MKELKIHDYTYKSKDDLTSKTSLNNSALLNQDPAYLNNIVADTPQSVGWLKTGIIISQSITLDVKQGTGDVKIQAGKTDFGDTTSGFILGIDDSDSNLAKLEIGNATDYLNWDGSNVKIVCSAVNAIEIGYGSDILLTEGGDIKFTSVTSPTACTAALVTTGTGNVDNGTHKYAITFVNATGETELGADSNTVTVDGTHKRVYLTNIPVSTSSSVTNRNIYRTKAGGTDYYLMETIVPTITVFTDNYADASLSGEPANWKGNDSFGKIIVDGIESLSIAVKNIFLGQNAGKANTTGYENIFIGNKSGYKNISGKENTFLGHWSGYENQDGENNIFLGYYSGNSNEDGSQNTFVGHRSGEPNESGDDNTFIGYLTGYNNTSGDKNTYLGYTAGLVNNGDGNVFLGSSAGQYETGSDKLFIDNQVRTNEADGRLKSLIYGVFDAAVANQKLIFNADVGIGTTTPDTRLQIVGTVKLGDDNTNYASFAADGELNFVGTAGLPYGSCSMYHGNWTQVAVQNTWYNVVDANMIDGLLNSVTHDGNGKLTVTKAGIYKVDVSLDLEASAANKHIEIGFEVSGSGSAQTEGIVCAETKFANEEHQMSTTALLDLAANATIELCVRTVDTGTPTLEVDCVNLNCVHIGGT